MTFGFTELQLLLDGSSASIPDSDFRDGIYDRLCQVLHAARELGSMAKMAPDIQPLIRHCLLAESARSGQDAVLRVPAEGGWPSASAWETA